MIKILDDYLCIFDGNHKMNKNFFLQYSVLGMALVFISGCVVLSNSDGIRTLIDYAQEQEDLSQDVKYQNDLFDELLARFQQGESFEQKTQLWFLREFGQPVLMTEKKIQGEKPQEVWIYRYAVASQAQNKIYVFFSSESLVERIVEVTDKD